MFVLARNIVKLVVERRRALPFARFRAKLVALLLGMTLVPAVLVLIVGSELIRTSVDRWFNAPMDEILSSANQIAGDYYHERQLLVSDHATRIARALAAVDLADAGRAADSRPAGARRHAAARADGRGLPRRRRRAGRCPASSRSSTSPRPTLPPGYSRAAADRLAAQALAGSPDTRSIEALGAAGDLLHAAAVIRSADGRPTGVVVATDYLTGELAARSRRMTQAYENYNQLRVLKRPLTGVYLSFFLMVTLLILVGATWMGLYLAKRITRPVQMLAAAAREIGAGRLDQRVEPQSNDEFGSLVEAFNAMAGELADEPAQGRAVDDRARAQARRGRRAPPLHRDDPRAHHDRRRLGRRRRRDHDDQQRGGAAAQPRSRRSSASRRTPCSIAPDLQPLGALLARRGPRQGRAGRAGDRDAARGPGAAPGGRRDARSSATAARPKASCWCSTT